MKLKILLLMVAGFVPVVTMDVENDDMLPLMDLPNVTMVNVLKNDNDVQMKETAITFDDLVHLAQERVPLTKEQKAQLKNKSEKPEIALLGIMRGWIKKFQNNHAIAYKLIVQTQLSHPQNSTIKGLIHSFGDLIPIIAMHKHKSKVIASEYPYGLALAFNPQGTQLLYKHNASSLGFLNDQMKDAENKLEYDQLLTNLIQFSRAHLLKFTPDSEKIIVVTTTKILVLDVVSGCILQEKKIDHSYIKLAALSNDGSLLAISFGNKISVWNIDHLDASFMPELVCEQMIEGLAFSRDDKKIFLLKKDGLSQWNFTPNNSKYIECYKYDWARRIRGLAVSHNGKYVVAGSSKAHLKIWDVSGVQAQLVEEIKLYPDFENMLVADSVLLAAEQVAFSPNDEYLFVCLKDKTEAYDITQWPAKRLAHFPIVEPIAISNAYTLVGSAKENPAKLISFDLSLLKKLTDFVNKLADSKEQMVMHCFLRSIIDFRKMQTTINTRAMPITNPLLTKLFKSLPRELQQLLMDADFVAIK